MCVKKYSLNTTSSQLRMKVRSEIYSILNDENIVKENKAVILYYIIKKSNFGKRIVLQCIHDLLEEDIIESIDMSQCPICGEYNLVNPNTDSNQCLRCGEYYTNMSIVERYRVKRKE